MPRTELKLILERASHAFWAVVAEAFPEVTTGDFGPLETNAWENACEQAVKSWVRGNYPQPVIGQRYELTHNVERYPHFIAPAGSVGTVVGDPGDIDLIRLRMDNRIPGAEEWDNAITWSVEDDPDELAGARAFFADAELVIETGLRVQFQGVLWREVRGGVGSIGFTVPHNARGTVIDTNQGIYVRLDNPVRDDNRELHRDMGFQVLREDMTVDWTATKRQFLRAVRPMENNDPATYEVTMVLTGLTGDEVEGIDKRIAEAANVAVKETHIGNILSTEG